MFVETILNLATQGFETPHLHKPYVDGLLKSYLGSVILVVENVSVLRVLRIREPFCVISRIGSPMKFIRQ